MLSALPNLCHVNFTDVLFKNTTFHAVFARKTLLESVVLRDCSFPFDDTFPYIIKELNVSLASMRLRGFAMQNYCYAISNMLEPEYLRELRLDIPDMLRIFLPLFTSKATFVLLKVVELVIPSECPKLAPFLECCPQLRRLVLYLSKPVFHSLLEDDTVITVCTTLRDVEIHNVAAHLKKAAEERLCMLFPRTEHRCIYPSEYIVVVCPDTLVLISFVQVRIWIPRIFLKPNRNARSFMKKLLCFEGKWKWR
jgi:hypothetical protein